MGLFRKKEVPEELPSLALDMPKNIVKQEEVKPQKEGSYGSDSFSSIDQRKLVKNSQEDEKGYFKDLIKSVTAEPESVDKLDSWYKNKFMKEDVVFQMREYWDKQQPEILLKNVSGELKNKLIDKTERLHELEREWQEVYFHLMGKEEAIRKEEKELKEALSEFIGVYKQTARRRKGGR